VLTVTLSDEIFGALVKDILSGTTEPGARLDEPSICRKFAVSRTPIREALRRLSGTGLVEVTPRKGVTVARTDVEQLHDMFEALGEFEALLREARRGAHDQAGEEAAGSREPQSRAEDFGWYRRFGGAEQRIPRNHLPRRAQRKHRIGHAELSCRRLRLFEYFNFGPGQTEYAFHEHDEIVEAVVRSDAPGAYTGMRDQRDRDRPAGCRAFLPQGRNPPDP
jgi:DNA-binding GntR family transcriptional regulator